MILGGDLFIAVAYGGPDDIKEAIASGAKVNGEDLIEIPPCTLLLTMVTPLP